jgi:hypothetical protein
MAGSSFKNLGPKQRPHLLYEMTNSSGKLFLYLGLKNREVQVVLKGLSNL